MIGVSGGLDSTHALIVAARAIDRLGLPRAERACATRCRALPPATRTLRNAHALMARSASAPARSTSGPPRMQMLRDIGHPAADGRARLRRHLRERPGRRAHLAPVPPRQLTTGPSCSAPATSVELALGWCTYGVGDQMSHYNVNASVPKTLIQFLLRWAIDTGQFGAEANEVLAVGARHRDLARADPAQATPTPTAPEQD